jgi:hypothetical protein
MIRSPESPVAIVRFRFFRCDIWWREFFRPAGNLACQAWRINYQYFADQRFNPYLYATPVSDFLRLVSRIRDGKGCADAEAVSIKVVTADCWPLPWYLRTRMSGTTPHAKCRPETAYIVIGSADDAHLENVLSEGWVGKFWSAAAVILSVYIEKIVEGDMDENSLRQRPANSPKIAPTEINSSL